MCKESEKSRRIIENYIDEKVEGFCIEDILSHLHSNNATTILGPGYRIKECLEDLNALGVIAYNDSSQKYCLNSKKHKAA